MDSELVEICVLMAMCAVMLSLHAWEQRRKVMKTASLRVVVPLRAPTEAERRAVQNCAERLACWQPVQSSTERWSWNAKQGRWDVCLELTLVSVVHSAKVCGTVEV